MACPRRKQPCLCSSRPTAPSTTSAGLLGGSVWHRARRTVRQPPTRRTEGWGTDRLVQVQGPGESGGEETQVERRLALELNQVHDFFPPVLSTANSKEMKAEKSPGPWLSREGRTTIRWWSFGSKCSPGLSLARLRLYLFPSPLSPAPAPSSVVGMMSPVIFSRIACWNHIPPTHQCGDRIQQEGAVPCGSPSPSEHPDTAHPSPGHTHTTDNQRGCSSPRPEMGS